MGLLDELKKLTKPYDDDPYLDEPINDPVRVGGAGGQSYTAYAEPPRTEAPQQAARRPYVFSQRGAQAQQTYAQPQQSYAQPQQGYAQQPRLLLVRPDRFELAADIADRIRERSAIVLNLENTEKDTTRRILDFLSGVTYALGGSVKRISGNTFIITPAGVDFTGDAYEEPQSQSSYF